MASLAQFVQKTLSSFVTGSSAFANGVGPDTYLQAPESPQLAWHRTEFYGFAHFGPNTFTGEEWGRSQPLPDVFDPTDLDTDQWAETFASAGMKGLILTTKHHDGMCLWNTSTTPYKVENSNWAKQRRNQGLSADIVSLVAKSCKKYGLSFGVYLSPWDMNRDPAMPKTHLQDTQYDVEQIFGDNSTGDYNDYYATQLMELVGMKLDDGSKVDLFEVWLDGASGSNTKQTFDFTRFRSIIREHQPNAVMWGHQGPDARWVGNEEGFTGRVNWHTINSNPDDERLDEAQLELGVRGGSYWIPSEADARIRDGWFWHEEETPKSPDTLLDMYLKSQGRSVNLILNVGPDTSGQVPAEDRQALMDFREARDVFLSRQIISPDARIIANAVRENDADKFGPANTIDSDPETYWTMDNDQTTGSLEVHFRSQFMVDGFIVQEHIALGQRIGGYAWDAFTNGEWVEVVTGVSMGYKRIDRLETGVAASKVRLRITQANAVPVIQKLQVLGVAYDET